MYLNAGTPLSPHLTFLPCISQSRNKSTTRSNSVLPERKGLVQPEGVAMHPTWNTHTDLMYPKHSTAHSNVQIVFPKCCFHLRSYKYCWEESNNARVGKMNTLRPHLGYWKSLAFTPLKFTFEKLLNSGILTVCLNIPLLLMHIRYTKSCIFKTTPNRLELEHSRPPEEPELTIFPKLCELQECPCH